MTIEYLENTFRFIGLRIGIDTKDLEAIEAFLAPLKQKSPITQFHYEHCLRVGISAAKIGLFTHLDPKPLLFAGVLHDLGKCFVALETLGKTDGWTKKDTDEVKHHVMDGYRMLRGRFDFTAEVILWHHRFQKHGYPRRLPKRLHQYSEGTKLLVIECGRMIAIADVYDALHRINDKFGEKRELTSDEILEKMIEYNPDRKKLILDLYAAKILI